MQFDTLSKSGTVSFRPSSSVGVTFLKTHVSLEPGETRFIKYDLVTNLEGMSQVIDSKRVGILGGKYHVLQEVPQDQAIRELQGLRRSL